MLFYHPVPPTIVGIVLDSVVFFLVFTMINLCFMNIKRLENLITEKITPFLKGGTIENYYIDW